ncbi:hypothetical protein Pcinc_016545 [Petrolisthes cinctipes]|uniref:Uncharacterized protein n=1 Tax=Petrolisthes cinctipes TaxID=88211 RepID=A0AAE1KPF8_PETCI|nr:hypothetical protein Pcinc_016545 [Petrolisthes cinctipes]
MDLYITTLGSSSQHAPTPYVTATQLTAPHRCGDTTFATDCIFEDLSGLSSRNRRLQISGFYSELWIAVVQETSRITNEMMGQPDLICQLSDASSFKEGGRPPRFAPLQCRTS